MVDVVMYTKKVCPYCVRAKGLLSSKGIVVKEVSIEGDDCLREEMISKSNGRMTVPQIFINETHIGGCDDIYNLENNGELDRLLSI